MKIDCRRNQKAGSSKLENKLSQPPGGCFLKAAKPSSFAENSAEEAQNGATIALVDLVDIRQGRKKDRKAAPFSYS